MARQFLDVGAGLPAADNTHQVAQRLAPESRIVYVDNDPSVLIHSRLLLTSSQEGACDYIHADFHDSDLVLSQAARTLDFTRPIALMFNGSMGHVADDDEAHGCAHRLVAALPSGSYLALSDGTDDDEDAVRLMELYKNSGAIPYSLRSRPRSRRSSTASISSTPAWWRRLGGGQPPRRRRRRPASAAWSESPASLSPELKRIF